MEVDVIGQRLAFGVNTQDGLAPLEIRGFNRDLTVKTSRTQQRRVKNIGSVRCRDEDQIRGIIKAIHLNQELVESLVAFIGAAAIPRTAVATNGVDFIDEDDRGSNLLGARNQVAHARGANTDVHFEKLGTGNGEEGGIGLSCNCLCQQSLTRSGRTVKQDASGNAGSNLVELFGGNQEFANFFEFFDGLIFTRDIREGDIWTLLVKFLRAALAEGTHHPPAANSAHEEPEEAHDDEQRQDHDQGRTQKRRLWIVGVPPGCRRGLLYCIDDSLRLRARVGEGDRTSKAALTIIGPGGLVRPRVLEHQVDLLRAVIDAHALNLGFLQDLKAFGGIHRLGLKPRPQEEQRDDEGQHGNCCKPPGVLLFLALSVICHGSPFQPP